MNPEHRAQVFWSRPTKGDFCFQSPAPGRIGTDIGAREGGQQEKSAGVMIGFGELKRVAGTGCLTRNEAHAKDPRKAHS